MPLDWEVYAIRYASLEDRPSSANFIGGDLHERSGALDFFVWLARSSQGQTFVIDTGFGAKAAAARGRQFITTSAQGLARLGVDAAAVEDVVMKRYAPPSSELAGLVVRLDAMPESLGTGSCAS